MNVFVFIIFFVFATSLIFASNTNSRINLKSRRKIYIILNSMVLIFFSGAKNLIVGIDTYAYYVRFEALKNINPIDMFREIPIEKGFRIFEYFLANYIGEFQFLLFFVAVLYIGSIAFLIYRYSYVPMLSFILFIGFGYYTFGMSTIRQTMAISIILFSFNYIKERKVIKYLFLVLLASTFHVTAIIFLPSYWLQKFKLNLKTGLLAVSLIIISFIFKENIRSILLHYSGREVESISTGGMGFYLLVLLSIFLGILYRKSYSAKSEVNRYLFNIIVFSAIIIPVTQFHPAVARLYYYYTIYLVIYIPNLLASIKDNSIKYFGMFSYTAVTMMTFFSSIIVNSRLERYLFFWQ